jgi:hypothetical protein
MLGQLFHHPVDQFEPLADDALDSCGFELWSDGLPVLVAGHLDHAGPVRFANGRL